MKQDAQWWREYRAKNRERLRTYNTELKRKRREEMKLHVQPSNVKEVVKEIVGEVPVKMDNQSMKAILEAQVKAALIAKVPLFTEEVARGELVDTPPGKVLPPLLRQDKQCKICGARFCSEVFYEDPDWSGNVWLCEKHRSEKKTFIK